MKEIFLESLQEIRYNKGLKKEGVRMTIGIIGGGAAGMAAALAASEYENASVKTNDFRSDILNCFGSVKTKCTCCITDEAGNTKAHVFRIAKKN